MVTDALAPYVANACAWAKLNTVNQEKMCNFINVLYIKPRWYNCEDYMG